MSRFDFQVKLILGYDLKKKNSSCGVVSKMKLFVGVVFKVKDSKKTKSSQGVV